MLPFIDTPFTYLASVAGAKPDELKLIFSFLLSYPLAGLLKRVPDSRPELKNALIISVSLFYLVGLFDLWDGVRTLFISSAGAYAIASHLRGSPYMPWVAFAFLMGHMAVNHVHRMSADPDRVDITGAQMVLVMKLTGFCWNVADGALPADRYEHLSAPQRDRMLPDLPPLLDYAAYVLFFPSLFAGPAFEFADYRLWLDTSMFDVPASVAPANKPPTRRKRRIPRSAIPAFWRLAMGLVWLGLFMWLSTWYNVGAVTGPAFLTHGFLGRVWMLHMLGFISRCKYYGVWSLTEGACVLAGLGFNGVNPVTGKVSWNRLQNIHPWGVESAQNTRAYLENWNINTNKWLRNYVYLRMTPKGQKPGFRASLATFMTSAFWHGFYPGYYLTFVLGSFTQTVAKNFRRYLRPFFLDPSTQQPLPHKKYYDLFSYLATQLAFSFIAAPFVILGLADSMRVWARVYFYGAVAVAAAVAFFASPAKAAIRRALENRAARAAGTKPGRVAVKRTASTDSIAPGARTPVLGLSPDPGREFGEAVKEIRKEVLSRKAAAEARMNEKGEDGK